MSSTVATAASDDNHRPPFPPVIDLSLLSQSELYSLSLSSDSNRPDDVVIPKINRAVFNESAGSRKQTYSRLRLASDNSTKTTTLHRRTPHLRASLTHGSNNINDPEQAENSLIIRMLKQLCKSDPNFQDVDLIDDEKNCNNGSVVPEFLNPETLGVKRKRGRPRKHENVVFIRPPNSKRLRDNSIKKEIKYDDEKDRVIVGERGVVVNLVALAGLEDPYGPEIRRRTVGMTTEDELLGFLRGLNGHWGSRRRKRRVVDACEFRDVLPKGWKLSLCIKKKEGRVWLYCRRYLSPGGRQFESFKEISAYLIAVIGEENLDKHVMNINSSNDLALKEEASVTVTAADLVQQEDIKEQGPVDNPSSSSPSPSASPSSSRVPPVPANCEEQVNLDAMEVHAESSVKNDHIPVPANCEGQVNLDAMEVHAENNVKNDHIPVPANCEEQVNLDAMEVHAENNVKNDHIGPCMENEIKKIEPSPAELDNSALVLAGDIALVETDDAHSGDKRNSCKELNTDELVHDLNIVSCSKQDEHTDIDRSIFVEESCDKFGKDDIMDDEVSRTDVTEQPLDDAISQSELLGDEVLLSTNDRGNIEPETSGGINVNSVDRKLNSTLDQVIDQDYAPETGWRTGSGGCNGDEDVGTTTGVGMVDLAAPEIMVKKASICEEKGSDSNMQMDINNTSNELISEEKVVADTSSGIFLGRFGLDEDRPIVVKGIDSAKAVSTETLPSLQKQESHGNYNNNNADKLSSGLTSSRLDELFDVGTSAFGSYEENEINKDLENDVTFSNMEEPMMQINSNKSEVKLDDFHIFRNNEPKRNESEDVLDFNSKSNLEFCSLVPSENEQAFGFQDCLYDNTMEECKEESSERGLLNHFSDDIFENKMYSTPLDGLKFDEDRDLNSNELSLAFGNSNVPSKIQEAFDVHTNLSMVNNSMVEDLKSGSGSLGGLFNLSGNVKTSTFQNAWEGIKSDEFKFKNSGSKFTTGFGSNHGQTHEEVVPSGMWRTGDRNQLQSGLPIPSHAHIPSPSSFHSFNIMPAKAGDGQFRLDERYNEGYGVSGLRSGRPEPVEFSFLTAGRSSQHNPHQLQGDPRVFSYNPGMNQQFDSNFWLGKSTMMPNPAGRNQMTGVCALCRNEFHLHPVHFGTQDGIASLCPSCSAGMSGHANML